MIRILVLSDIHANFPALQAIEKLAPPNSFDLIVNCGDSIVYGPFPNETITWLNKNKVLSILGNTDLKTLKLLTGSTFKRPKKAEKRIMYTWTADVLTNKNTTFLKNMSQEAKIQVADKQICLFHGSPANPNEFLFADTGQKRFNEIAKNIHCQIIITGHSHSAYVKKNKKTTFLNPGSVGRMFDGDPRASYAILQIKHHKIKIDHYRCKYDIDKVCAELKKHSLPDIYRKMFQKGKKLN